MLHSLKQKIGLWWHKTRLFFGVLSLIRFSLLVVLIATIAVFIGQIQEVLAVLAEANSFTANIRLKSTFVGTAFLCALTIWYSARVMFRFKFEQDRTIGNTSDVESDSMQSPSDKDCFPRLKKYLPRWLGAYLLFLLSGTLVYLSFRSNDPGQLRGLAFMLFIAALAFLGFVYYRRDLPKVKAYEEERKNNNLKSFRKLPELTLKLLTAIIVFNIVLIVVFTFLPDKAATAIGPTGVVLSGAITVIPVGSALVWAANWYRVPVITLLAILVVLFSYWNDNHRVRQCDTMQSTDSATVCGSLQSEHKMLDQYKDIETYFADWIKKRTAVAKDEELIPLFIIAAEGGGIRAAYWAGTVLAKLQDESKKHGKDFASHVFAISGVSGGSLGASVFNSLLMTKTSDTKPTWWQWWCGGSKSEDTSYWTRAQQVLSQDYLSPTLAVMLFPDLLQRFLPLAIFDDRAMALEESWERGWNCFEPDNRFSAEFQSLWASHDFDRPLLFLNSTAVETGQRVIANPLNFTKATFERTFSDALHAGHLIGTKYTVSTAAHLSARFTYVSPAGLIERQDNLQKKRGPGWLRLVDGGYFENSGAVTANEILSKVLLVLDRMQDKALRARIRPTIIHISNEAVDPPNSTVERERSTSGKRMWLGETISPIKALLNVRPARGFQAREQLEQRITRRYGDASHIHFRLYKNGVKLPLGWMLSERGECDINRQLIGYPSNLEAADNVEKLKMALGRAGVQATDLKEFEKTLDTEYHRKKCDHRPVDRPK